MYVCMYARPLPLPCCAPVRVPDTARSSVLQPTAHVTFTAWS